jgi:Immunity protein 52
VFIGAYWSARQESREEAAARVVEFLRAIASVDELVAKWFLKKRNKKAADIEVQLTAADVARRMTTNRYDPVPELGFNLGVWNGSHVEGSSIGLSMTIGGYSRVAKNAMVMTAHHAITAGDKLRRIMNAAVDSFDPENAAITSHRLIDRKGVKLPWEAGWLLYERGKGVREDSPFESLFDDGSK